MYHTSYIFLYLLYLFSSFECDSNFRCLRTRFEPAEKCSVRYSVILMANICRASCVYLSPPAGVAFSSGAGTHTKRPLWPGGRVPLAWINSRLSARSAAERPPPKPCFRSAVWCQKPNLCGFYICSSRSVTFVFCEAERRS